MGKNQIAICQSFAKKSFWLTGIEVYYHFSFPTKHPDPEFFYAMAGVSATIFTPNHTDFQKEIVYYRIGKAINFSEKYGLNLDSGFGLQLDKDTDVYQSKTFPTFAIHFFVRVIAHALTQILSQGLINLLFAQILFSDA